jgi:hypothetical protein
MIKDKFNEVSSKINAFCGLEEELKELIEISKNDTKENLENKNRLEEIKLKEDLLLIKEQMILEKEKQLKHLEKEFERIKTNSKSDTIFTNNSDLI